MNMHARSSGMSLIELIIAFAMASILTTMLYQLFYQISSGARKSDAQASVVTELALVGDLIERDFSAAFIPRPQPKKAEEKPAAQEEKAPQKWFYATQEAGRLKMITCMTTHHLAAFGESVPDAVRVVYTMEPSKTHADRFILKRQESAQTDLKDFSSGKVRAYDLLADIGSCECTFYVRKEDDAQKKEKKESKQEYLSFKEWDTDEQKKKAGKGRELPHFMKIHATCSDDAGREHVLERYIEIFSEPYKADQKKDMTQTTTQVKPEEKKGVQLPKVDQGTSDKGPL